MRDAVARTTAAQSLAPRRHARESSSYRRVTPLRRDVTTATPGMPARPAP